MKFKKPLRCSATVKPGEYLINRWDYKQCEENHPQHLIRCERCGKLFCIAMHWGIHMRQENCIP